MTTGAEVSIYTTNHREVVQDMRPLEAVEYLLEVIETVFVPPKDDIAWTLPGLTRSHQMRRVLRVLAAGKGGVVTHDTIYEAMRIEQPDAMPNSSPVTVMICKLRQALAEGGLPIHISNVWGIGYRLTVPDGWVWPWEEQA